MSWIQRLHLIRKIIKVGHEHVLIFIVIDMFSLLTISSQRLRKTPFSPLSQLFSWRWYSINFSDAIPCACCLGSFSHQLSECILNAKATSHMAPTQEASGQSLKSSSFCLYSKPESKQSESWLEFQNISRLTAKSVMRSHVSKGSESSRSFDRYMTSCLTILGTDNLNMSAVTCLRDKLSPLACQLSSSFDCS